MKLRGKNNSKKLKLLRLNGKSLRRRLLPPKLRGYDYIKRLKMLQLSSRRKLKKHDCLLKKN